MILRGLGILPKFISLPAEKGFYYYCQFFMYPSQGVFNYSKTDHEQKKFIPRTPAALRDRSADG